MPGIGKAYAKAPKQTGSHVWKLKRGAVLSEHRRQKGCNG